MIRGTNKKILILQIYNLKTSLTLLNFIIQAAPNAFFQKNKIYALFAYFFYPAKKQDLNDAIICSITIA